MFSIKNISIGMIYQIKFMIQNQWIWITVLSVDMYILLHVTPTMHTYRGLDSNIITVLVTFSYANPLHMYSAV